MLKRKDIRIRDPFILPTKESKMYYLYGTTDENVWEGKGCGFNAYKSKDLINWQGPYSVFRPDNEFWADRHFWAPEVYEYQKKYYMFASFKSLNECRGTQVLVADSPLGPFKPHTPRPITPSSWECLDGSLFIDNNETPWMIFSHEWVQVQDGRICVLQLTKDLKRTVGDPTVLFQATHAPWTRKMDNFVTDAPIKGKNNYLTDGPFVYKNKKGKLLMIWSSIGDEGYTLGIARSDSGNIQGPWIHEKKPLFSKNGGHGMLFHTFEDQLILAIHKPSTSTDDRLTYFEVRETKNGFELVSEF